MNPLGLLLPMTMLVASAVPAQQLDCPGSTSRSSDSFHFHVSMYRPDTRGFFDAWGINQFSSQSACDRAREAQMKRNLVVVDSFKRERGETNYEPDRFGTCHADLSTDKTNPRFLTDAQRIAQIRGAEDIRQRVRERLLDENVPTDSEIYRSVAVPVSPPPALIGGPKLVAMPPAGAVQATYSAADLRSTKAVDTAKPTMASLDLPLVDAVPGVSAAAPAQASTVAAAPPPVAAAATPVMAPSVSATAAPVPVMAAPVTAAPSAAAAPAAAAPEVAPTVAPAQPAEPIRTEPAVRAAPTPEPAVPEVATAEDVADNFIALETQRIQNVLKASSVIADGAVKAKIYEACGQRIQLLSNLRSLIETSGAKSRLAGTARSVRTEGERLAFVSKLFGDDIKRHWAPADATDVILEAQPEIDNDVERVLRDNTSRYNDQQKRRAFYTFLARSQPTEDQQLWLATIAGTFLQ